MLEYFISKSSRVSSLSSVQCTDKLTDLEALDLPVVHRYLTNYTKIILQSYT